APRARSPRRAGVAGNRSGRARAATCARTSGGRGSNERSSVPPVRSLPVQIDPTHKSLVRSSEGFEVERTGLRSGAYRDERGEARFGVEAFEGEIDICSGSLEWVVGPDAVPVDPADRGLIVARIAEAMKVLGYRVRIDPVPVYDEAELAS